MYAAFNNARQSFVEPGNIAIRIDDASIDNRQSRVVKKFCFHIIPLYLEFFKYTNFTAVGIGARRRLLNNFVVSNGGKEHGAA